MFPIVFPRKTSLLPGVLVKRYKRFLADIQLDSGDLITAHCVNTGAMEGLTAPGIRVWVSRAENPARKLAWTWEIAEVDGRIYGVDTSAPNRVVGQLLKKRALSWLSEYDELEPERRYPGTLKRADFWMRRGEAQLWLEVKNCHLVYPDGRGYFPDCVSDRAAAHMGELARLVSGSGTSISAEVLFFVQVPDVQAVRPSDVHDPTFAAAARAAAEAGVRFSALVVRQTPQETIVERTVPVDLDPYDRHPVETWRLEARRKRENQ